MPSAERTGARLESGGLCGGRVARMLMCLGPNLNSHCQLCARLRAWLEYLCLSDLSPPPTQHTLAECGRDGDFF